MMSANSHTIEANALLLRCLTDELAQGPAGDHFYYHEVERVAGAEVVVDGRTLVMMSSNEYLGLSQHPRVVEAATEAIRRWGASPCGSRLANGTRSYHIELEEELADFLGAEACHVFSAGYLACMAAVATLVHRGDVVLADKSIHSSLVDGCLLSHATLKRFRHDDLVHLERLLKELPATQPKAIVVDGVYSIEGHIASLGCIADLAETHGAMVIVDDAHGLGVLGAQGRGTVNHLGLTGRIDVQAGSFSKSLASTGGFIAADREIIRYLRAHSRQIIFSAALSPAPAAAALAALRLLRDEPEHHQRLQENSAYYRRGLSEMGIDYWDSPTASLPIVLGSQERCQCVWQSLWDDGFFTVIVSSPGVAAGHELIRTAITALHTREQIDRFLEALKKGLAKCGS